MKRMKLTSQQCAAVRMWSLDMTTPPQNPLNVPSFLSRFNEAWYGMLLGTTCSPPTILFSPGTSLLSLRMWLILGFSIKLINQVIKLLYFGWKRQKRNGGGNWFSRIAPGTSSLLEIPFDIPGFPLFKCKILHVYLPWFVFEGKVILLLGHVQLLVLLFIVDVRIPELQRRKGNGGDDRQGEGKYGQREPQRHRRGRFASSNPRFWMTGWSKLPAFITAAAAPNFRGDTQGGRTPSRA